MSNHGLRVTGYSESDLPALAQAHLEAYKGYKNAGIGRRYVREFLRWFLKADSTIALKAEFDGQPCGYVVGLPVGRHTELNRDLLSAYAIGALTHPWVLLRQEYRASARAKLKRILKQWRNAPPVPTNSKRHPGRGMGLTSIAVSPRFAGNGAGAALMLAFEERARQMQYDYLRLSVYADNDRARGVYERAGWTLDSADQRVVDYEKPLSGQV